VLLGRAEPRTIAQKGQLNAVTGTAFDTFTLTDPVAQDKVLKSPLIAFQATMSDGQSAVFRARKNCDVQGVPTSIRRMRCGEISSMPSTSRQTRFR
jgi:hypothetical protein